MTATLNPNGSASVEPITIRGMDIKVIKIKVEGEENSPLIMHRWSEKAKKQMRDKQQKKATRGKEVRDPNEECIEATYFLDRMTQNRYGFPATAFYNAILDAALAMGAKKSETRRAFQVRADAFTQDGPLVEIDPGTGPSMREDMVTVGMGTDLRYRPEFLKWSAVLTIAYDSRQISAEILYNLVNQAGFSTGIGEWRQEKGGTCGAFHVVTE